MTVKLRKYKGGPEIEVEISFPLPDRTTFRRRYKSPFATRSASKEWGLNREKDLWEHSKHNNDPKPKAIPTLREFAPVFIERHCRAKQQKPAGIDSKESALNNWLLKYFGDYQLDKLDDSAFQELAHLMLTTPRKDGSKKPRRPKTVNNAMSLLSTMLKKAHKWKVIPHLPFTTVEWVPNPPTEVSFHDFDAYEALVAVARDLDPRIYIAHLLYGDAGLRRGELIALDTSDFDFSQSPPALRVNKSEWRGITTATKGMNSELLPLTPRLAQAILDYVHAGMPTKPFWRLPRGHRRRTQLTLTVAERPKVKVPPAPSNDLPAWAKTRGRRLLLGDGGAPLTAKIIQQWMYTAQKKAGFRVTGASHILRHTFCSHLGLKGEAPSVIQKLARHSDIRITMRYVHVPERAKVDAISRLRDDESGDDAKP